MRPPVRASFAPEADAGRNVFFAAFRFVVNPATDEYTVISHQRLAPFGQQSALNYWRTPRNANTRGVSAVPMSGWLSSVWERWRWAAVDDPMTLGNKIQMGVSRAIYNCSTAVIVGIALE